MQIYQLLGIVLFVAQTGLSRSMPLENLIEKINEQMETYQQDSTFSCRVTSTMQKMDKHWQPKDTQVIEKKMRVDSQDVAIEVIHAIRIEDGKQTDITEEVRKEMQNLQNSDEGDKAEKKEFKMTKKDMVPFGPDRREQYNFTLLPDTLLKSARYYRIQSHAKESSEEILEGIYWINAQTFVIEQMEIHPAKNPKFVKEMDFVFHFQEMPGDHWNLMKMHTRVYAGFLFKKFRMCSEEVYSDYQFD